MTNWDGVERSLELVGEDELRSGRGRHQLQLGGEGPRRQVEFLLAELQLHQIVGERTDHLAEDVRGEGVAAFALGVGREARSDVDVHVAAAELDAILVGVDAKQAQTGIAAPAGDDPLDVSKRVGQGLLGNVNLHASLPYGIVYEHTR